MSEPTNWLLESITASYGLDWGASVFGLISVWRLSERKRDGFGYGLVSNAFWIAFNWTIPSFAGIAFNAIWFAINIRGLSKWKREPTNASPTNSS